MKLIRIFLLVSVLFQTLVSQPSVVEASTGAIWVIEPDGVLQNISTAINEASPGDTILVKHGIYKENLVINKSLILEGENFPIIDGGEMGTVITIKAKGVKISGFDIRGSGIEPDQNHAGVTIEAADTIIENNRINNVLFGIFIAQADRALIRENKIESRTDFDLARKGDAIRVWYSKNVHIVNNQINNARDVVAWYSNGIIFKGNIIEQGRYGIHLMYCNQAEISNNKIFRNSVGIYTMYSKDVVMQDNDIRFQRGPSGYAIGFKDSENILVTNNLIVDNRAGFFLDGTPYTPSSYARFHDNIVAYNDIGALLLSFVSRIDFERNTFWENVQQVALQGDGNAGKNLWSGNYWSDYTGYDASGDGIGEVPYNSERFFEGLIDREPILRALIFSPAAQAIEFAAMSFPVIKPLPKLIDQTPNTIAAKLPAGAVPETNVLSSISTALIGIFLVGLGFIGIWTVSGGSNMYGKDIQKEETKIPEKIIEKEHFPLVQIDNLEKKYGKAIVLTEINLHIYPGESVALWGENGAGKTTLIRSMLGLVKYSGNISIDGMDVLENGKNVRSKIGYVPQEAIFYDMTVRATMDFYSKIKGTNHKNVEPLLEKLGLIEHLHKPVPLLSGGLKQRLALAVALLADPPLLLLDEPTANLDAKGRREYIESLNLLRNQGKTIVFASHRIEEVESIANRVIILGNGRVLDDLPTGEMRLRSSPEISLTLWIPENQRQKAKDTLLARGWPAHLNGRGTVVVQLTEGNKTNALTQLINQGIIINDFEIEGVNN